MKDNEHIFRVKVFENDSVRIRTRSGRAVRFVTVYDPGELFPWSTTVKSLGVFICGMSPGDVFGKISETVANFYCMYTKPLTPLSKETKKRFDKEYARRFEEF